MPLWMELSLLLSFGGVAHIWESFPVQTLECSPVWDGFSLELPPITDQVCSGSYLTSHFLMPIVLIHPGLPLDT